MNKFGGKKVVFTREKSTNIWKNKWSKLGGKFSKIWSESKG